MLEYLYTWGCIPIYWDTSNMSECIPIYPGTPVYGDACTFTGVSPCMGMNSHTLGHPSVNAGAGTGEPCLGEACLNIEVTPDLAHGFGDVYKQL